MAISSEWCVAVFKCSPSSIRKVLVDVYRFADGLKGICSLHFLITDRVEDEVVISLRVLVDPKFTEIVKNKLSDKLGALLTQDKYAVEPAKGNSLQRYALSLPERKSGESEKKFNNYTDVLKKISDIAIDMIENDFFDSSQRVDLTHFIAWILGCTECGILSAKGIKVGYYDRVEDNFKPYLKYDFSPNKS